MQFLLISEAMTRERSDTVSFTVKWRQLETRKGKYQMFPLVYLLYRHKTIYIIYTCAHAHTHTYNMQVEVTLSGEASKGQGGGAARRKGKVWGEYTEGTGHKPVETV